MAFPTPIGGAMMITLGGRPYAISKLEDEAARCRWVKAFALFRQEVGYQPVDIAALLAVVRPCFIPGLAELLPKYDRALPWHDARPGELVTALLAIAHLNFPSLEMGGHT